jgi:hypothetical protein
MEKKLLDSNDTTPDS